MVVNATEAFVSNFDKIMNSEVEQSFALIDNSIHSDINNAA